MKILRLRKLRKRGMSSTTSRKTEEQRRLRNLLNTSNTLKASLGIIFLVLTVMSITMTMQDRYRHLDVTVGFNADLDYYNSFDFQIPDPEKTKRVLLDAISEVPDIYGFQEAELVRDLSIVLTNLKEWLEALDELEAAGTEISEEALGEQREKYEKKIAEAIPDLEKDEISIVTSLKKPLQGMNAIQGIINDFLDHKITLDEKPIPRRVQRAAVQLGIELRNFSTLTNEIQLKVRKAFEESEESEKNKLLQIPFFFINKKYISTKYIFDDPKSKDLLEETITSGIEQQYRTVKRGSAIISRGGLVQQNHILQLMENAKRRDEAKTVAERLLYYLGNAAAVAALLIIFALFLWHYHPKIFRSNARLAAITLALIIPLALSKTVIHARLIHPFLDYPIFAAFAAVIITLMFTVEVGYVAAFILAASTGLMFDLSLPHTILALIVGIAAAHYSSALRRRSDLVRVGLMTGGVSLILTITVSIAQNTGFAMTILWQGLGSFFCSAFGVALATFALPLFEFVFKISTNISLMELTDTKNPLIKRLVMETPGTYHHSLVVGNLAEAAAEEVGANPLLARVGAYYHDIGKLKKPEYFSENEKQSKSKHDSLIPSMSSLIIVSHVKEGVDLAIKQKLGKEIIDIIKQHHGTNLVYYFYKRAIEKKNGIENIDENDFRYPGPKPQTKEAAIIMLADSVEAASRSLDRVSSSKITSLVHEITTSKFSDGQLDECDLTLKDLHKIEETFTHILMGSLHQRVKYPKDDEKTTPKTDSQPQKSQDDRTEEQPEIAKN